jgi:hypothetical protein
MVWNGCISIHISIHAHDIIPTSPPHVLFSSNRRVLRRSTLSVRFRSTIMSRGTTDPSVAVATTVYTVAFKIPMACKVPVPLSKRRIVVFDRHIVSWWCTFQIRGWLQ